MDNAGSAARAVAPTMKHAHQANAETRKFGANRGLGELAKRFSCRRMTRIMEGVPGGRGWEVRREATIVDHCVPKLLSSPHSGDCNLHFESPTAGLYSSRGRAFDLASGRRKPAGFVEGLRHVIRSTRPQHYPEHRCGAIESRTLSTNPGGGHRFEENWSSRSPAHFAALDQTPCHTLIRR